MADKIDPTTIPLIQLTQENLASEHICCAIGKDKVNQKRADQKKEWLAPRILRGHRFLKADLRGKVFMEYSPVEESVFPVSGPGYHIIQCFWVSGRYKGSGLGRKLFQGCIEDLKARGSKGLLAVSSKKKRSFMTDQRVLEHLGFTQIDETGPWYNLMLYPLCDSPGEMPRFWDTARAEQAKKSHTLEIFFSGACPFFPEYGQIMKEAALDLGFTVSLIELKSREDLEMLPIPWGMFSVFWQGELLSAEPMTGDKFTKLLLSMKDKKHGK